MASDDTNTRDADSWARHSGPLSVGEAPAGALNLNVEGRELAGPVQGFGKLWQKTYRVALPGVDASPEEVIAAWKANYGEFWPEGNNFYAPLAGIQPGEVGLINADMPGGMKLSTGVMVLYADDVSFTYMTPIGHPFAGWITFSADRVGGTTHAQVEVLMRATDPASEVGLALGGHRTEDRMWEQTLQNLAGHFGLVDTEVATQVVCVDRKRQWHRIGNIRHDAALHTAAHVLSAPVRAIGMSWRGLLTAAVVTNAVVQAALMGLLGELIPPAVVLAVLSLVGLGTAGRAERVGAILVALVGLVQAVAVLPFAGPALLHPASPVDFVHGVASLLAAATMLVAGVALARGRTGSPRRLALSGGVLLAASLVVSAGAALSTSSDDLDPGEVPVVADDGAWTDDEVIVAAGGTLHVDNRDPFHHDFTVDGLDLVVQLPAGTAHDIALEDVAPGTYAFHCSVPGHEQMAGTLQVTE